MWFSHPVYTMEHTNALNSDASWCLSLGTNLAVALKATAASIGWML